MSRAQEYRLRSFEMAHVRPHIERFEELGRGNWLNNVYFPSAWPEGALRLFLLREASNWIRMGQQCGYFSAELAPLPIGQIRLPRSDWGILGVDVSHLDQMRIQSLWSQDWTTLDGGDAFGEELTLAMEDLTDDRLEFLRLFFFSEETEWAEKLVELAAFARVVDGSKPPFSAELIDQVDKVAWALQGPESTLHEFHGFPADWRVQGVLGRSEMLRAESLEGYRNTISTAVEWNLIGELPDDMAKHELDERANTAAEQILEDANARRAEEAKAGTAEDSNGSNRGTVIGEDTGKVTGEKEDRMEEKPKFRQSGGDDIESS